MLELLRFKSMYKTTVQEVNEYYCMDFIEYSYNVIVVKCFLKPGARLKDEPSVMLTLEQCMYDMLSPWFHEMETARNGRYVICVNNFTTQPCSEEVTRFKQAIVRFFNFINSDPMFDCFDFVMGEGKVVHTVANLVECLNSALFAVDSSVVFGVNKRYDSNFLDPTLGNIKPILTAERKQMITYGVESLNLDSLHQIIQDIFVNHSDYYAKHPDTAYRIAQAILVTCASTVSDNIGSPHLLEHELEQMAATLSSCVNVTELKITCTQMADAICGIYQAYLDSNDKLPIAHTKRYIVQNYQKPLRLPDIAEYVGLNPQYLSVLFKRDVGISMSSYIAKIRIEKAKLLLQNTNLPITDIAENVGYEDSKYFSRVFKRHFGIRPTEFRKQCRIVP